jgi:hypothetical protein
MNNGLSAQEMTSGPKVHFETYIKLKLMQEELLLRENKDRFVLLPIKYPAIWEMYKKE